MAALTSRAPIHGAALGRIGQRIAVLLIAIVLAFLPAAPRMAAAQIATGSISGHVYQQDGSTPIPNPVMEVLDSNFEFVNQYLGLADGSFTIPNLADGSYYVMAMPGGYGAVYFPNSYEYRYAQPIRVSAPGDTSGINFSLLPEGTISGHVYQQDGITPLVGAQISVQPRFYGDVVHAQTNATGVYTVHGLTQGIFLVKAEAGGYDPSYYPEGPMNINAFRVATVSGKDTPNIDMTLWPPTTSLPASERQVLVNIYNTTGGPNWVDHTGWLTDPNPCLWSRVYCRGGHVYALPLSFNHLTGSVPTGLTGLPGLKHLLLDRNALTGPIPDEIGSLTALRVLQLQSNQLNGPVPTGLTNLTNLLDPNVGFFARSLDLGYNALAVPEPYPSTPPTALEQFLEQKDPGWQLSQVKTEVIPPSGGTLTSQDSSATITFPTNSVNEQTTFNFIPQAAPSSGTGSLSFANQSFQLVVEDDQGHPLDHYTFAKAITLSMHYDDANIQGLDERFLKVYYWDTAAGAWVDAAESCTPVSTYSRNLSANTLTVGICHLSEFALLSPRTSHFYLPSIRK